MRSILRPAICLLALVAFTSACGTNTTGLTSPSGVDATGQGTLGVSTAPSPGPSEPAPAPEPDPPGPSPTPGPTSFRVTGTVIDGLDAVAVSNASVSILPDGPNPPSATTTDAQGQFEITVLNTHLPVHAVITTSHAGYADDVVDLVVSTAVTLDVQLDPVPFTLWGYVRDERSWEQPRCETHVEAMDGPSAGASVTLPRPNYSGDYEFPNLQPGTFTVRAWANGYYMQEHTARLRGFAPFDRLNFVVKTIGTVGDYTPPHDCSLPPAWN